MYSSIDVSKVNQRTNQSQNRKEYHQYFFNIGRAKAIWLREVSFKGRWRSGCTSKAPGSNVFLKEVLEVMQIARQALSVTSVLVSFNWLRVLDKLLTKSRCTLLNRYQNYFRMHKISLWNMNHICIYIGVWIHVQRDILFREINEWKENLFVIYFLFSITIE